MSVRTHPTGLWLALGVIAAPFLALIALQTYQAVYHVPALTRSRDLVVHTFEVISTAQALDQALQDAGRGERGFLITGELAYIDPYRTGIRNAPVLLEKLKQLTANNPEQQRRLPNLAHQIDIKLAELRRAVEARERSGFEAAQQIVQSDVGFDAMLAINGLIDATIAAENQLLTERLGRAAEDERRAGHLALVSATVAALTMLLGMVLAILAFRNLQQMEAARRAGDQRFGLLVQGVADHALYMVAGLCDRLECGGRAPEGLHGAGDRRSAFLMPLHARRSGSRRAAEGAGDGCPRRDAYGRVLEGSQGWQPLPLDRRHQRAA